jgi:hypothetical protein
MSWLKIDDAFEDHPKVEPLSNDAHRLWVRAATWCRKACNAHTNGFVPEAMLETIAKRMAPKRRLLKLAQELVDARAGGMFQHGLWETRDCGWQFHDWGNYQPEVPSEPMSRSEAARTAGKRSAEVRRTKHGTAQPRSTERTPNEPRTNSEAFDDVRPNDVHRTNPERPEPPDPDPDPEREDPPTPFDSEFGSGVHEAAPPRDSMAYLQSKDPTQRPDVIRLHEAWKKQFGFVGHKFRRYGDPDAVTLAESLDTNGETDCFLVLEHAPNDGMVSGRDDEKRVKHESIRYIFGNAQAFARILRAAHDAEKASGSGKSITEKLEALAAR